MLTKFQNLPEVKFCIKKNELVDSMLNYLNQNRKEEFILTDFNFENETILVDDIDYYFSKWLQKNQKQCWNVH